MTKSVLIPQQVEEPKQKKRSGFSQFMEGGLGVVGGVAGAMAGGVAGGPAGAVAGGLGGTSAGMGLGRTIGDAVAPGTTVGGETVNAGFKPADSNAMQRRQEMLTKDPLTTLQEAQAALALRSPDEQKQYGPALEQAMNEARRERGYV